MKFFGEIFDTDKFLTDVPIGQWTTVKVERTLPESGDDGHVIFIIDGAEPSNWKFRILKPKLCVYEEAEPSPKCSPVDCGDHFPPDNSVSIANETAFPEFYETHKVQLNFKNYDFDLIKYRGYGSSQKFECDTGFTTETYGLGGLELKSITATCGSDGAYNYTNNASKCYPVNCGVADVPTARS